MKKAIRIFDLVLLIFCTILFGFIIWGNISLPNNISVYDGNDDNFNKIVSYSSSSSSGAVLVDSQNSTPRNETLKLFGIFPIKDVAVTDMPSQSVMVSGEVFGIKLYTDGIIVVGTQDVETDDGEKNPAKEAGIEVGDIIISIDNVNVYSSDEVQQILNDNNGLPYNIKFKRGDRYVDTTLSPVYSQREGCYKAGMWVRDSTAGIGTLTFYNQNTGKFGALGHQINDVDTNEIMPMLEGEAVSASVTNVQKASKGTTGSLECDFLNQTIGRLTSNEECGIFGTYSLINENSVEYPVAAAQQVEKGDAKIICTVEKGLPKEYDIEIIHISYNESNKEKNMVIKIIDDDLIEKTGGIVQGMSGSPIIQNGMLVGALTHVIVNNPQKGYAVFAQTMLEETQ